jgi:hypothetical protein
MRTRQETHLCGFSTARFAWLLAIPALVLFGTPVQPLQAATEVNVPAPDVQADELDEVLVRGTSLWKLRQEVVEAEERFYALYNQLNPNDDFDVECRTSAPLGTRIQKRSCKVAFVGTAEADYARALLTNTFAVDPDTLWLQRRNDYRTNALNIINNSQQLLKLVRERERAGQRYDDERRKRFKRK